MNPKESTRPRRTLVWTLRVPFALRIRFLAWRVVIAGSVLCRWVSDTESIIPEIGSKKQQCLMNLLSSLMLTMVLPEDRFFSFAALFGLDPRAASGFAMPVIHNCCLYYAHPLEATLRLTRGMTSVIRPIGFRSWGQPCKRQHRYSYGWPIRYALVGNVLTHSCFRIARSRLTQLLRPLKLTYRFESVSEVHEW